LQEEVSDFFEVMANMRKFTGKHVGFSIEEFLKKLKARERN